MRVLWGNVARADLLHIRQYIALTNPQTAARLAERIRRASRRLGDLPRVGRPGRCPGTRELVVTDTSYRITPDAIEVLRVLHGRQRWPDVIDPD